MWDMGWKRWLAEVLWCMLGVHGRRLGRCVVNVVEHGWIRR